MMKINWANFGSSSSYSLREIQSQSKRCLIFKQKIGEVKAAKSVIFFDKIKA
jgi:hypothetical protein